jgi:2-oxoglutarate ferredoxin oxidoreductase subunit beta
MLDALLSLELEREKVVVVAGIGCCGRIVQYLDCSTVHTPHGRALAVATGAKIADPDLEVLVVMGDGDCTAIGGNHLIHAARRNIDLTVIMLDNAIYGMTGGQVAPTTPTDAKTQTTPYGNPEPAFDACGLATAAGATHVARYSVAHPRALTRGIAAAIRHVGFSFVHVISPCPTQAGRYIYNLTRPAEYLRMIKDRSMSVKAAARLEPNQREGKIVTGVLHECGGRPEFTHQLARVRGAATT